MQTLFIRTPNVAAHIERISGLILREGELATRVPGTAIAALFVRSAKATRAEMLAEGWDAEDFL